MEGLYAAFAQTSDGPPSQGPPSDGPPPADGPPAGGFPMPPADGSPYFPITERAAHLAVIHLAGTTPLLFIGLLMFVVRIWIRIRPAWRISWEDYVFTLGVAAAIVDFGFMIPQMYTSPTLLTEEERLNANKYGFLAIPVWGVAITLIKASIALTLLRIQPNLLWWRIFLWSVIAIMAIYGVGNTFFILLQCRPLEASWNPAILAVTGGTCLPQVGIHIMSNIGSAINIASDVLLSLAPIMFLWKLKRPFREKVLVGCLMGLGLFASVASVFKTIAVTKFGKPGVDMWALTNSLATWTALEQLVAMIAASAPFLKPVLQPVFHRFGLSISGTRTGRTTDYRYGSNGYHRTTDQNTNLSASRAGRDDKQIRKTTIITTSVTGFGDSDQGSEDGIPLEPRPVKHRPSPSDSGAWVPETQSERHAWVSQKQQTPAQAV
ncbi:hypothetical protein LIA77_03486 [Sarocladium implicatum]|nr:hypothetical protein LIA77_03486 [Sarocladium implicatum]